MGVHGHLLGFVLQVNSWYELIAGGLGDILKEENVVSNQEAQCQGNTFLEQK